MRRALDYIAKVAPLSTTVFITGPSGSGKEFAAKGIHAFSTRSEGPFVAVNCGAIPRDLLESELFGSEKGAYTGSVRSRAGLLENAAGGTLFLDEIGDMPMDMQVKLLRVLEDRTFSRVGSSQVLKADIRLVCATHRDLMQRVEEGAFREDLYYRINVFPIVIGSLEERGEDIPRLVELILKRFRGQGLGNVPRFSAQAVAALQAAQWPGNIRQLRNVLERATVLHGGETVGPQEIEDILAPRKAIDRHEETLALLDIVQGLGAPILVAEDHVALVDEAVSEVDDVMGILRGSPDFNFREHMTRLEVAFIKGALSETQGSVSGAARMLGLQRTTLIEKMRKYAIQREDA